MSEEVVSERLRVPKLAELVAGRLAEWISSRDLRPGARMPSEKVLMERFGVARTVVREAIANLRARGVVEVFQGRGAFVAEVPLELLLSRIRRMGADDTALLPHIWEMREIVEGHIAELAAMRRTREDVRKLEASVRQMDEAIAAGELGVEEDERFHLCLTRAAHNPVLEQVMLEISGLIQASRMRALSQPDRPRTSSIEHAAILRAVKAGNPKEALMIMRSHVAKGRIMTVRNAAAEE